MRNLEVNRWQNVHIVGKRFPNQQKIGNMGFSTFTCTDVNVATNLGNIFVKDNEDLF